MVLQQLHRDGVENVTPVKSAFKKSSVFPETSSKGFGAFSHIPSSKTPIDDSFGATPKVDPFGNNPIGNGAFGDGPSSTPFANSCAPASYGSHGRQHPGLNNAVTVNLNGLTVSDSKAFGQGLFGSYQYRSDDSMGFPPKGLFSGSSTEEPTLQSKGGMFDPSNPSRGGLFDPSNNKSKGGLFDPSNKSDGGMFGSAAQSNGGMFGSSAQSNSDVFGSSAQADNLESTTPLGRPLFHGQPKPTFSTIAGFTPGGLFGNQPRDTSTPATGPFLSSTPLTSFGQSGVSRASYRYNPTTGTAKVSERSVPDIAVTESSPKDAVDGKTTESKPFGGETNKRARPFTTVEDESAVLSNNETGEDRSDNGKATDSFTPSTGTNSTIRAAAPAFAQWALKESTLQQPPPLRPSLFGQTPPSEQASTSTQLPLHAVPNFTQRIPLGAFPPAGRSNLTTPFGALNIQESTFGSSPSALFKSPAIASSTPAGPPPPPDSTPSIHSQNSTYMFDSPTPGARFAPPLTASVSEAELFGAKASLERQKQKGDDEKVFGGKAFAERQQKRRGEEKAFGEEGRFGEKAFSERQNLKGQDEKIHGEKAFADRQEKRGKEVELELELEGSMFAP